MQTQTQNHRVWANDSRSSRTTMNCFLCAHRSISHSYELILPHYHNNNFHNMRQMASQENDAVADTHAVYG